MDVLKPENRENLRAIIYYALLLALLYSPVVIAGKSLLPSLYQPGGIALESSFGDDGRIPVNSFNVDIATPAYFEMPIDKLVGNIIKDGSVPLWNPYQAGGTPLLAQYSTRALFPLQILQNISPVWTWDFYLLSRLLIAGFFSFLLLRSLSLSFLSSFIGGLFYIFSGSFTWFINLEQMTNVAMMVPVLLCSLQYMAKSPSTRSVALSALAFALSLYAGQPEIALYLFTMAGAFYLYRFIYYARLNEVRTPISHGVLRLAASFTLGLLLAAPLLLPFLELWSHAHHIHHAGGRMGAQALASIDRILPIFTPTATEFAQDPFMVKGLCPLVENAGGFFYRYLPINGVWDSLGGFSGVLPIFLIITGFITTFSFKRAYLRGPLLFFLACALLILLKNLGVIPFVWLGSAPLFDQVWSLRWAGPIWTFALSMAAAVAFETLIPLKTAQLKILLDTSPGKARLANESNSFITRLSLFLDARPYMPALVSCVLIFVVYTAFALQPALELVFGSKVIFPEAISSFAAPSIGGAIVVFYIVLFVAFLLTLSIQRSKAGHLSLVALAALELWWAVPRGYLAEDLYYKWLPFLVGLIIVRLLYKRSSRIFSGVCFLIFILLTLIVDLSSTRGMPERADPFDAAPPYIDFIKSQEGNYRVAGTYGLLMPNFASSVGISDIHYVNSLLPESFHNFRSNYLHADRIEEEPVASLWFTGREARCSVIGGLSANAGLYAHYYRPPQDDLLLRINAYSLLGVKYFIMPKHIMLDSDLPLVYDREVRVFENPFVMPRAWITHDLRVVSGGPIEAQRATLETGFNFSTGAIVERGPVPAGFGGDGSMGAGESVVITDYAPGKVSINYKAGRDGLLVLSDNWYPGWKAVLNDKSVEIERVDGLLRGVYIMKGEGRVDFIYRPLSFSLGVLLFFISLIICAILFIRGRARVVELQE